MVKVMGKFFIAILILFFPLIQPMGVSATHPVCDISVVHISNIKRSYSDPEKCGPGECYKDTGISGMFQYTCYTNQLPNTPPKPAPIPLTSPAGKSCLYGFKIGKFEVTNFSTIANPPYGLQTAVGCIPTKPDHLIMAILYLLTFIGGGIAFLIMLFGVFQLITSAGNPDTVKAGHDKIINAVIGLLFIIFSVLLLQIIGQDILKIPGFFQP